MSLLSRLFSNKEVEIMENWKKLTEEKQLEEIKEISKQKTVAIFKHSTRCGISAHAMHKLETAWDFTETDLDFYYLDLIAYRSISNKIAEVFNVLHQSPQVVVIKNCLAISNFSHQSISVDRIRKDL